MRISFIGRLRVSAGVWRVENTHTNTIWTLYAYYECNALSIPNIQPEPVYTRVAVGRVVFISSKTRQSEVGRVPSQRQNRRKKPLFVRGRWRFMISPWIRNGPVKPAEPWNGREDLVRVTVIGNLYSNNTIFECINKNGTKTENDRRRSRGTRVYLVRKRLARTHTRRGT